MLFLKGFLLALTAATATSSVMSYVRWMLTLSDTDRWLRDRFPAGFYSHHVTELIGFPLVVWLLGGFLYFIPVLLSYLVAQHFRITAVFYYLAGGVICAGLTAFAFVGDPRFEEIKTAASTQYLAALIQLLPACLVGASVFWWIAGWKLAWRADRDDEHPRQE